jgi:hypothetical protein
MANDGEPERSDVDSYVSNPRFSQRFTLPATSDHDELIFSYGEYGLSPGPENQNPPTLLFIPGLFASRHLGLFLHVVAERHGVRVLVVDR